MRSKASLATLVRRTILGAENSVPVKESSATALVRLTGLAIICLNQQNERCEIGILRDKNHQLTIKILQPFYEEGTNDVVRYLEVVSYQQLPPQDVRVDINAQNPSISGYQVYQNGNFDRLGSNDLNDFRWLVDMQGLNESPLGLTTNQQRYPLTKIYINSGLLYTRQLDQQLFFDKVTKANGVASSPQPYGMVAKTMGAQIDGAAVTLTVQNGAQIENHVLPRIANLPSIIEIKNMDTSPTAVYSDMPDYYRYIACPSGKQVVLQPGTGKPGLIVGKATNQVDFCHPVVFPLSSIDLL